MFKYDKKYVLYTTISHDTVAKCLHHNVAILRLNTIQRTYFIRLSAMVEFQNVNVTMLLYCVQIQHKVRTLYDYQLWYSCKISILQCYYIVFKYNITYQLYRTISHCKVAKCLYHNVTICVQIQCKVHTLDDYQPWKSRIVSMLQCCYSIEIPWFASAPRNDSR